MSSDLLKQKREHHVLSEFLEGTGLHHQPMEGCPNNPHDGWICSGEERQAAVELIGYVFGNYQAILSAWKNQIWKQLDEQRRQCSALRNVFVHVELKNGPRPLQNELADFTCHLLQIIKAAWETRETLRPLTGIPSKPTRTVWVEDRSRFGSRNFRQGDETTFHLDPAREPLAAKYVHCLQIVSTSSEWPEWWGPDMNGGTSAPDSDRFKDILEEKQSKAAKYQLDGKPLCLVISCGDFEDVQTHFLPGDERTARDLVAEVRSCGFDFTAGPFAKVWLFSLCNRKKALIYSNSDEHAHF